VTSERPLRSGRTSLYSRIYFVALSSRETTVMHRTRSAWIPALLLGIAISGASAPAHTQTLTVFAAASLADVLADLLPRFGRGVGGKVLASYAASSALARQIERGAPADLFVSADQAWMDYLAQRGRIDSSTRSVLVRNRLVLIAHAKSIDQVQIVPNFPLSALLGDSRLAMGDPQHVPAGRYAQSALVSLRVWDSVARRIAAAENVRAALSFVARGEARLGIVYATDAIHPAVRIVGEFPADSHPPIEYPAALIATAPHSDAARKLLAYLRSREAGEIFRRHNFVVAAP